LVNNSKANDAVVMAGREVIGGRGGGGGSGGGGGGDGGVCALIE